MCFLLLCVHSESRAADRGMRWQMMAWDGKQLSSILQADGCCGSDRCLFPEVDNACADLHELTEKDTGSMQSLRA
jgi:hypothetical protein